MERTKIQVNNRDEKGKEAVKKLRSQGVLPAVVYSHDSNLTISIPTDSIKILKSLHFSESAIIDMEIADGKKTKSIPVLIKEVQFHPLTEEAIHIDFLKVSLKEKIKVHVPLVFKGEAKGVKDDEGVLEQVLRELEIEGLPLDIPEHIDVDISELTIGHSLHAEDIAVADNLKVITDPKATIVTVVAKKEEEIVEEEAAAEEGAGEPEVIKEKKDAAEGKGAAEGKEAKESPEKEAKGKKE